MKLLLFGATGRVGHRITVRALHDTHIVTALVRNREHLLVTHDNLLVLTGNVLSQRDVGSAMFGVDAVLSALNTDGSDTLSRSMPIIIDAMEQAGVKRIVTIGTAGILQSHLNPLLLRYQSAESKRKSTRAAKDHRKAYEILSESGLDWTIVCPTWLPDGEPTGKYRIERDFLPLEGEQISVGDTADFAYQQLFNDEYMHCRVGIAY